MSSTATAPAASPPTRTAAVLAVVLVSYFMILLDNSIVFTGLPRIRAEFGFSTAGLSWVQTAYALVFGGLLLLCARAGDAVGRRRLFLIGLGIFAAASLSIGFAPTGEWMIMSRAIQGVGAAILAPTSLALLTAHFPEGSQRTRAIAAYGTTAGLGASLGLVIGGLLADLLSWRVGFLMNVPIGVGVAIATLAYVRETPRFGGRFDTAGAVTSTLGMTSLVYGITRTADAGWVDPVAITSVAGGLVVLAGFVLIEWRATRPILPLRVFRSRARGGAFIARMLFSGSMFGYFFFASQYMQGVLGFSPLLAGAGFLPMTILQFTFSLFVPRLTRRYGNGNLVAGGLAITLTGMIWISFVGPTSNYWTALALPMLFLGVGQGIGFAPLTAAGVVGIEPRDAGAAAGAVNVAHQVGGALGVSIMVAAATTGVTGASRAAFAAEASSGFVTGAVLLGIALTTALLLVVRWRVSLTDTPRKQK